MPKIHFIITKLWKTKIFITAVGEPCSNYGRDEKRTKSWAESLTGVDGCRELGIDGRIIIKWRPVARFHKHYNKPLGSKKSRKFLKYLSQYQFLKNCVPQSQHVLNPLTFITSLNHLRYKHLQRIFF